MPKTIQEALADIPFAEDVERKKHGQYVHLPPKRQGRLTVKNPKMAAAAVMDAIFGEGWGHECYGSMTIHAGTGSSTNDGRVFTRPQAEALAAAVLENVELVKRRTT